MVAPISAPMLQMVALPVALTAATPGPKYSTIAPVPPETVRIWATRRMTSFGDVQPDIEPVRRTPIIDGQRRPKVPPVMTSTASAPPTPMATMPSPPALGVWLSVPIIMPAGEGVLLEDDLVDDPRARLPEPDAVPGRHGAQEVVDLLVGLLGHAEVDRGADLGLDQVVAVDRRRHPHLGQAGGHELEERHLGGGVLHGHPVGAAARRRTRPGPAPGSSRRAGRRGGRRGPSRPGSAGGPAGGGRRRPARRAWRRRRGRATWRRAGGGGGFGGDGSRLRPPCRGRFR